MKPETLSLFQTFIPILVPLLIALIKVMVPRIPRLLLPVLAPIFGAGMEIIGHYAGLTDGNTGSGMILGAIGVCVREVIDQLKKATSGNLVPPVTCFICLCFILTGCARFTTVQTDERINEKTGEKTKITTRASSSTFFDSKSNLAKWKATQNEKSQGAEVGGLSQEASGSNVVSLAEAIARGAAAGASRAVGPVP
jgi:hypothetical protein